MENIVMTGSRGFIGTNIRSMLSHRRFKYEEFDLTLGTDQRNLVGRHGILIHLASWRKEDESFWKAPEYIENNVSSLAKILSHNNFSKIIFPSSASVYDSHGNIEPTSVYGLTKLFAEKLIRIYTPHHWILRLFQPYGPHDTHSVFYKLAQCKKTGETFRLHWSENLKRDYFHVQHVCETIEMIINDLIKPGTYNVGTGKTTFASQFLLEICEKHGIQYEKVSIPIGTSMGYIPEKDYICGGFGNLEEEWIRYL